jgi:DNA-binding winged helix-turn-helix (wHTH) protein
VSQDHQRATREAPTLRALVAYLRPSPRASTLAILAELGIFVEELGGPPGESSQRSADVGLVYAQAEGHLDEVLKGFERHVADLVVILPPGTPMPPARIGGPTFCQEEGSVDSLRQAIVQAATRARMAARVAEVVATGRVFGDVDFQRSPCQLVRDGRVFALSRPECDALSKLVDAAGHPVSLTTLSTKMSSSRSLSAAYLRTVVVGIRRKAELLGGDSGALRSVRGYGYVLNALIPASPSERTNTAPNVNGSAMRPG